MGIVRPLVIGTRGSSLSLRQTRIVQTTLEERHPTQRFQVQPVTARADRDPELPLTAMSREGIFVKELETALVEGRVDLAVHSMKDLPLAIPEALCVAAVVEREEPRDALVSRDGRGLHAFPAGARVGTSSLRRQSQLRRLRPDLACVEIRGNVDTRLRKLDEGQYDAIVLASCGLIRLGLEDRITERLGLSQMLPEPGQGALAIETRNDDAQVRELVRVLDHAESRACVDAERAFLQALGGGCRVPIAAYAACHGDTVELDGAVIAPDGAHQVRGMKRGPITQPRELGQRLAEELISLGALALLNTH